MHPEMNATIENVIMNMTHFVRRLRDFLTESNFLYLIDGV